MEESILSSIKKLLGISDQDNAFDLDILININSIFSTLFQIGVGKEGHYTVTDANATWNDVFADRLDLVDFIKLYTYLKVRVIFDPPTSSYVLDALNNQIKETEWRIQIQAESRKDLEGSAEDDDCCCDELSDEAIEDIWNEIMQ